MTALSTDQVRELRKQFIDFNTQVVALCDDWLRQVTRAEKAEAALEVIACESVTRRTAQKIARTALAVARVGRRDIRSWLNEDYRT